MWWVGPSLGVVLVAAVISRRAATERPVKLSRTRDEPNDRD
jgi:hypothetical protein